MDVDSKMLDQTRNDKDSTSANSISRQNTSNFGYNVFPSTESNVSHYSQMAKNDTHDTIENSSVMPFDEIIIPAEI
jgi:hypothetical protein